MRGACMPLLPPPARIMPPLLTPIPSCAALFAAEPVLASFAHMTVIMHSSLQRSLAFILANKLQSSTLLGTQLTRLFVEAYEVRPCCLLPVTTH